MVSEMPQPGLTNTRGLLTSKPDRASFGTRVALLAALVLGAGLLGFGHDHSAGDPFGHHCALCHVQQTALEQAAIPDVAPEEAPRDRVSGDNQSQLSPLEVRLSPPLRGPPVA